MPGTTPRGYPYPLPTEPVAEGAQAIRNLAEAIKGWQCLGELDLPTSSTFSAIPQTFDHLRLVVRSRSVIAALVDTLTLRFNDDSATNYYSSVIRGANNVLTSIQGGPATYANAGSLPGANVAAGYFSATEIEIPHYALTSGMLKAFKGTNYQWHGATVADQRSEMFSGTWINQAAITKIGVGVAGGGAHVAGSRAWLYGISGI